MSHRSSASGRISKVEVLETSEPLARIASAWDMLDRLNPPETVFLSRDFLEPTLQVASSVRDLRVYLLWAESRLVGIAPFARDTLKVGPLRLSRLQLARPLRNFFTLDIRLFEESAYDVVSRLLTESFPPGNDWSLLSLRHISANGPFLHVLHSVCRELRMPFHIEPSRRETFLYLDADWPSYLARLRNHHRNQLNRRIRNVVETPGWRFVHSWPTGADIDEVLSNYRDVVRRSWKSAEADDATENAFREKVFRRFCEKGNLLVSRVEGPDGWEAADAQLRFGTTISSYHTVYAEDASLPGLGAALLGQCIAHAHEAGFAIFDFAGTAARFTHWCPRYRNVCNVYVARRGPVGGALIGALKRRSVRRESPVPNKPDMNPDLRVAGFSAR